MNETFKDIEGITRTRSRTAIDVSLFWGSDLVGFGADIYSSGPVQTVAGQSPDPQPHWFGHFSGVSTKELDPLRQKLLSEGYDELAYLAQVEEGRRHLQQ